MANKKLTKSEVGKIEDIQNRMQAVKAELGQLGLAEIDLQKRRTNVEKYLEETTGLENELVTSLEDKYGKGSIDVAASEFIPTQVEKQKEVVPTVE